jgi:hypothetical protein
MTCWKFIAKLSRFTSAYITLEPLRCQFFKLPMVSANNLNRSRYRLRERSAFLVRVAPNNPVLVIIIDRIRQCRHPLRHRHPQLPVHRRGRQRSVPE